jgi:hypothetical protein
VTSKRLQDEKAGRLVEADGEVGGASRGVTVKIPELQRKVS